MWTYILVAIIIACVCILWRRRDDNLPPGPFGIPFLGCLPLLNLNCPEKKLIEMAKRYGSLMTVRLGDKELVIVSDYHLVKDIFSKSEAAGRPGLFALDMLSQQKQKQGLVFSEGSIWHETRRFTMRHLKELGVGKSSMNDIVSNEVESLLERLREHDGQVIDFGEFLTLPILNIIWTLTTGSRVTADHKEFMEFIDNVNKNMEAFMKLIILSFLPSYLFKFVPLSWFCLPRIHKTITWFRGYLQNHYDEMEKTLDENHPRHLIDYFIMEANKHQNKESYLNYNFNNLARLMGDLFAAGLDTTATTTKYGMIFLLKHPEVQNKIYDEIVEVLGPSKQVRLEDRPKLNYLEAVINEIQRCANIVPLGLLHRTLADIKLQNYIIPKDTIVAANIEAIHRDPQFWDEPEKFKPERFLDADGNCKTNVPGFMPFSLGKRRCAGESLARAELFLMIAALVREFQFYPHPEDTPPELVRLPGLVIHPAPYQLLIRSRHHKEQY